MGENSRQTEFYILLLVLSGHRSPAEIQFIQIQRGNAISLAVFRCVYVAR